MIKHERYNLMPVTGEYYFSIRSSDIYEDVDFILKNNIRNIKLNDTYEFTENNLVKIKSIDINKMYIHPHSKNKFSYSDLSYFKNLEYLIIQNERPDEIDLSCNTKIKYLCVGNCSKLYGLGNLIQLESLTMTKPTHEHLSIIEVGNLYNLRKLCLYNASMIQDFSFLMNSNVEDLLIYGVKSVNFSSIDSLRLKSLKIEKCKVVQNVEFLFQCKSLTELYVIDSFNIGSAHDLNNLSRLEVLVVIGSSVINNGDLSPLIGKLRHFGFDNKRHYSMKYNKFRDECLKIKIT